MVPAKRKQLSGMSSHSPFRIIWKPRRVSFKRNVLAGHTGKLLCHREALGQETLYLSGAAYGELVLFGKLVHTHDGDDILKLFVTLKHSAEPHGRSRNAPVPTISGERIRLVESRGSTAG